jgi:hypothetical protein
MSGHRNTKQEVTLMKTALSFLALGAALFAGHAIAATVTRLPFSVTTTVSDQTSASATETDARIVLIDSDDDEGEGEGKGKGWTFAFGGDDEDDDEGAGCATGTNAANPQGCSPANAPMADPNAPPPANGLFGGAQPPKVQIN